MARVTTQKTREPRTCEKCGDRIERGQQYQAASPGFRSRRLVRCMKPECYFRQSELTTSKMAGVYAAQENADDDLDTIDNQDPEALADEIQPILDACAEAIREVAQEYHDASDNWAGGERPNDEWDERADELDSAADEVEQFDVEPFDPESAETPAEYVERIIDDVRSHINDISLP